MAMSLDPIEVPMQGRTYAGPIQATTILIRTKLSEDECSNVTLACLAACRSGRIGGEH